MGTKYRGVICYGGLGKCCCLRSLAARVAAVAAYAWARGTLGRQPIREGEEKKTRLDIFLEPLEIGEIKSGQNMDARIYGRDLVNC